MKQGHFIILYALLFFCCLLMAGTEQYRYDSAKKEKERMEQAIRRAVSDATRCLARESGGGGQTSVLFARQAFFETLGVALGKFEKDGKTQLEVLVPVFEAFEAEQLEESFVLAQFQGWTVSNGMLEPCESFAEAVGTIRAAEQYVVEVPVSGEQPYAVYHRENCGYTGSFGAVAETVPKETAVRVYGAFGCPYCIESE